jgi:secreted Zn-dependent insulinase-like peptidase
MKVLEAVFMHINELKKEGIQDYVFNELKIKNELDFIYTTVKKSSLETANELVRKMPMDKNITEILEINRKPFRYDAINKADIMNRLNLLTTENMYVIFHSKSLGKLKDKNPKEWKTDHYYSKSFAVEELSNETIRSLNQAQKPSQAKLGYPPQNKLMP